MDPRFFRTVPALVLLALAGSCDRPDAGLRLSDRRIVLTPGNSATLRIRVNGDDRPGHPVQLKVRDLPDSVSSSWHTLVTEEREVELTLSSVGQTPIEATFQVTGRAGPHSESADVGISVQVPTAARPGAEEFAPGVTGEIKTLEMDGALVTYEVVDGTAFVQGDIVLGSSLALEEAYGAEGFRSSTCNFGFTTEFHCSRWTDGVIGYSFANDWGDEAENERMRDLIEGAIDEWQAETGIRFARRAAGEFLQFRNGNGCSSTVGRAVITGFDSQSISLHNTDCDDHGIILHEIGHAIGLYHEQSRDDRDQFVTVDFGQVQDGKLHQFFQMGEYERDIGPYDYGSIMQYGRSAFARDKDACDAGDLSRCTVEPDPVRLAASGVADIGQRDNLSEGDILGAYTLYPPQYTIRGAEDGEAGDRFVLSLDYDTPRPRASRIEWRTDRHGELLGTGHSVAIGTRDVPMGTNVITASFIVLDTVVISQSISLDFVNEPPLVSIRTTDEVYTKDLGQPFLVLSEVTDPETGACEPPACTYTWDPEPNGGNGRTVASFTFDTEGPHAVTLTVEDRGGVVGQDSFDVDIFNTAPTVSITDPSGDSIVWADGQSLPLRVRVEDANSEDGRLDCAEALSFSSSNPDDFFDGSGTFCQKYFYPVGPGTRTISVVAEDPQGLQSVPDTLEVFVPECAVGTNCAPIAVASHDSPPSVVLGDGTEGWFIEDPMELEVSLSDPDGPDGFVHDYYTFEVWARPACGVACDALAPILMFAGDAPYDSSSASVRYVEWTPGDDIAPWTNCAVNYRRYDIVVEVTDPDGETGTSVALPTTLGCVFI